MAMTVSTTEGGGKLTVTGLVTASGLATQLVAMSPVRSALTVVCALASNLFAATMILKMMGDSKLIVVNLVQVVN